MEPQGRAVAEAIVMGWAREDLEGVAAPPLRALASLAERIERALEPRREVAASVVTRRRRLGRARTPTCSTRECGRPVIAKGLCRRCWDRARYRAKKAAASKSSKSSSTTEPDGVAAPNPTALGAVLRHDGSNVADHRSTTCPRLRECLRVAAERRWPGLSCRACPWFGRASRKAS